MARPLGSPRRLKWLPMPDYIIRRRWHALRALRLARAGLYRPANLPAAYTPPSPRNEP